MKSATPATARTPDKSDGCIQPFDNARKTAKRTVSNLNGFTYSIRNFDFEIVNGLIYLS